MSNKKKNAVRKSNQRFHQFRILEKMFCHVYPVKGCYFFGLYWKEIGPTGLPSGHPLNLTFLKVQCRPLIWLRDYGISRF